MEEAYQALLEAYREAGQIFHHEMRKNYGEQGPASKKVYAFIKKTCGQFQLWFQYTLNTTRGNLCPTLWYDGHNLSAEQKKDLKVLWNVFKEMYPKKYKKKEDMMQKSLAVASSVQEASKAVSSGASSVLPPGATWEDRGVSSGSSSLPFSRSGMAAFGSPPAAVSGTSSVSFSNSAGLGGANWPSVQSAFGYSSGSSASSLALASSAVGTGMGWANPVSGGSSVPLSNSAWLGGANWPSFQSGSLSSVPASGKGKRKGKSRR